MPIRARLRHLYRNAFQRKRLDSDLQDELHTYSEMLTERKTECGIDGVEARRAVLAEMGGIEQVKERCRQTRPLFALDSVASDLIYAVRTLRKSPAFTLTVIFSLALGIGATAALLSGVNGLLLRTVPVPHPETLIRVRWAGRNEMMAGGSSYGWNGTNTPGEEIGETVSYPIYQTLRRANRALTDLAASAPIGNVNTIVDGNAELAPAIEVSGNYFDVLDVKAQIGRTLTSADDDASKPAVAVISFGYWKRRFGGSSTIIGRHISMNNVPVTIIGVLPKEFTGIQSLTAREHDLYLPIEWDDLFNRGHAAAQQALRLKDASTWWVQLVGRLKPGSTLEQVTGNLDGPFQDAARESWSYYLASITPDERALSQNQNKTAIPHLEVDSAKRGVYDPYVDTVNAVKILGAVVALVMLIVCANVANLSLSKAMARKKEISVRMSLGASRSRLVRQLLTESFLLALAGGVMGIVIGYWGRQLLPFASQAPMDWRVLGSILVLCLAAAISFGLTPALRVTRLDLVSAMKETGRSVTQARSLPTKALIVFQVMISLTVLIGAGLFVRTLINLRNVHAGFDTRNLILFSISPRLNGYTAERIGQLYEELQDALSAIPRVRRVAHSQQVLLDGGSDNVFMYVQGRGGSPQDRAHGISFLTGSPEFLDTLGIPIVRGRNFDMRDTLPNAPQVSLINEAAVKKFFPGEDPIGQRWGRSPEVSSTTEIVGIFADAKTESLRTPAAPTVLLPFPHQTSAYASFEIRTDGDPAAFMKTVRETVHSVDSDLPIVRMLTQSDMIDEGIQKERFFAVSYSLFGALAMVLVSIGIFGVMSYNVGRRENEIGVRMALGAQAADIVRMVLWESLTMVAIGIVMGGATAMASGRIVRGILFGLSPADPATFVVAATILICVAALAGYLPARRASRFDPMDVLRHE